MKIEKSEKKFCILCMEEHEVQTVIVRDTELFKDESVSFNATYEYCAHADEYLEDEDMMTANSLAMKDAYRQKVGLLTSKDIMKIREKYGISQKDFSEILEWGRATITRYENHQVQDRAHDDILRKLESDPKWFLEMLKRGKGKISDKAYKKYLQAANYEFSKTKNRYLIDSIQALYANLDEAHITCDVALNLDKVIEIINYYATNVTSPNKGKVMKMLWYCDSLSFKRRGQSITGLVYCALPMGKVPIPVGYDQILQLDGVKFDTVFYDDCMEYLFHPVENFKTKVLIKFEIEILEYVIETVDFFNFQELIDKMQDGDAWEECYHLPILNKNEA